MKSSSQKRSSLGSAFFFGRGSGEELNKFTPWTGLSGTDRVSHAKCECRTPIRLPKQGSDILGELGWYLGRGFPVHSLVNLVEWLHRNPVRSTPEMHALPRRPMRTRTSFDTGSRA